MRINYSRLARVEEGRNIRKAILYVFLSISSIVLIIIFGIPALAKMAAFLSGLRGSSVPVENTDITPPAPPRFDTIPEYTNRTVIEIKGFGEPDANIKVFANTRTDEVIVNNEGYFLYDFNLQKGENKISALAEDKAGNKSQNSGEFTILFDDEPPTIEITTPKDGESFYGSRQRQITVEGKVNDAQGLTINGRVIALEVNNSFTYSVTLQEGENNFEIKAVDSAGNDTMERITVQFWR